MELKIRDWTVIGTPADILEIIRLSETPVVEPVAEQKEEKPKSNRKKDFDIGKARALRDAGWSYAKIGDEMHVSEVTVAKRLKEGGTDELEGDEE